MESTVTRNISGSPVFDSVKLDLAVTVLVALSATLVIARLDAPHWFELLVMAAVGLGSGAWIVLRTRHVARTCSGHALESVREVQGRADDA